jgi:hypothetical protein
MARRTRRRRRCAFRAGVRSVTRVASIRCTRRVERLGLFGVAARIRAGCILSEGARMRVMTRRARCVALRRRRGLQCMARRAARFLLRLVRRAMAGAALGMTRPRSDGLLDGVVASRAECRAGRGADEREVVLHVAVAARDALVRRVEGAIVLGLLVARRAGVHDARDRAGLRMWRVAADAMTRIALRRGMLRRDARVALRTRERGRSSRLVWIVAARAGGMLLHLRRGERLHVRMTART